MSTHIMLLKGFGKWIYAGLTTDEDEISEFKKTAQVKVDDPDDKTEAYKVVDLGD